MTINKIKYFESSDSEDFMKQVTKKSKDSRIKLEIKKERKELKKLNLLKNIKVINY